jgi:hypothetical protein
MYLKILFLYARYILICLFNPITPLVMIPVCSSDYTKENL